MTTGGWIVLIVSVTSVASLAGFCFWRVLTAPPAPPDDVHEGES